METMKFKCTLLSDIILSQDSSTEGNQLCLDFIPGSNFLGIVAGRLYNQLEEGMALAVFHSGKVRFGDAHPSLDGQVRGLKVPGAMYHPKSKKASEECYIHHLIPNPEADEMKKKQLKQCREGFHAFGADTATPVSFDKNFAIKSAYDEKMRRSKDGQMFGYQSLPEGLVLYFGIESDLDKATNGRIKEALVGAKHIGRSRTAQYGLVNIEEADFSEVASTGNTFLKDGQQYATVYADGRLIFLDENGEPTFQPSAEDLGFTSADEIDWSRSQVRTFQYAPWNGKRNTFDTDRCGIEKGSVFVVRCASSPAASAYLGYYRNEGFGKVIYNPAFLAGDAETGKACCRMLSADPRADGADASETIGRNAGPEAVTPLLTFLRKAKKREEDTVHLYMAVNEFVSKNAKLFKGAQFASQWGAIRNIAMSETQEYRIPQRISEYLGHGVAKAKWEEGGRKKVLEDFMSHRENLRDRIINLASEMAKKCRKEDKR